MLMIRFTFLYSLTAVVYANTEKSIFLGPPPASIPLSHPTLDNLHVDILTPTNGAIRTHVEAQFPNISSPHGKATWLVLDDLTEGQRYEVRVCWAATQPTDFKINIHELQTLLEVPELLSGLSEYSQSRRSPAGDPRLRSRPTTVTQTLRSGREASVLFLQILAAADYYTMDKSLMRNVPPVYVDIILDPFVFGVLPQSLLPTVGYIAVVAVASWFIAQYISIRIRNLAAETMPEKKIQ
ncbi:hypothetical protein F5Y11DRAFT_61886 [Daldinia sp. FL1419]|nr:hypothetical protein F5Y11DRAFT_61886 [Daldinia sp. FL1419]